MLIWQRAELSSSTCNGYVLHKHSYGNGCTNLKFNLKFSYSEIVGSLPAIFTPFPVCIKRENETGY